MRIGVLTLPLHTNYGGILQAYAMQHVLKREGHNVVLLDRDRCPLPIWYLSPFVYCKRIFCKLFLRKNVSVFREIRVHNNRKRLRQHTNKFIIKYIKRKTFNKFNELKSKEYDCLVVGSDQVWRPLYASFMLDGVQHAFLDFAKTWSVKRIAYAASFGTDEWEFSPKETSDCSVLSELFDFIGVRESSGIKNCKKYLNVDAHLVPDPTLLLEREDYIRLIQAKSGLKPSGGNLMVYILDQTEETCQFVDNISNRYHLIPFAANVRAEDTSLPIEKRVQPPVEQWLKAFLEAELIVTDSFHACVFSIIFNKPFLVIGNKKRGESRFISLLNMFGLNKRLVLPNQADVDLTPIDYTPINKQLEKLRAETKILFKTLLENK